jgi:hypothetical protein
LPRRCVFVAGLLVVENRRIVACSNQGEEEEGEEDTDGLAKIILLFRERRRKLADICQGHVTFATRQKSGSQQVWILVEAMDDSMDFSRETSSVVMEEEDNDLSTRALNRVSKVDDHSSSIASKLLQGWTLLGDHCPVCVTPLVRNR